MTPFTDDDLKRLKEHVEAEQGEDVCSCVEQPRVRALIGRLEAAEQVIRDIEASHGSVEFFVANTNSLPAWRKAAGKNISK